MVISNAIAHSGPAKKSFDSSHKGKFGFDPVRSNPGKPEHPLSMLASNGVDLTLGYRTIGPWPRTLPFVVSVKYARGFSRSTVAG